jgi:hypothetical protein
MANKKAKNRKKPTKTRASIKRTGASRGAVKKTARSKIAKKKSPSKHKAAKPKPALKQAKTKTKTNRTKTKTTKTKTKTAGKKATAAKRAGGPKKQAPNEREILDVESFELEKQRSWSAGQAGDLQGLSDTEGADSESVDELLGEGNAFEAEVVSGVESAGSPGEVRTHELPEDDVPGEYLDEE